VRYLSPASVSAKLHPVGKLTTQPQMYFYAKKILNSWPLLAKTKKLAAPVINTGLMPAILACLHPHKTLPRSHTPTATPSTYKPHCATMLPLLHPHNTPTTTASHTHLSTTILPLIRSYHSLTHSRTPSTTPSSYTRLCTTQSTCPIVRHHSPALSS